MKKFLLHIAGFVSLTILLMAGLDFTYTRVYENSRPRTKFQYLRSFSNKEIDCAFLGSSRVDNGIVPEVIKTETGKRALNLGFQASKPSDIFTILKLLHSYDVKASQVFVQIDYIYNADGYSNMMEHEIMPFIRDNDATYDHFAYKPDQAALYYAPFYRYCMYDHKIGVREIVMNILGKKTPVIATGGYHPLYGQNQNTRNALPATIWKNNAKVDSITSFSRRNHIPVRYFCAPFDPRTKNLGFVAKLKTKLPNFLDYSQTVQDTLLFQNYFHLNDPGAREFTSRFAQNELKKKAP